MEYEDIRYEVDEPNAIITIDRPKRLNAFRGRTVEELIDAFYRAWTDSQVACAILTGAGERAFCVGGDQKEYAETGSYGASANGLFEIDTLHNVIRDTPKPVIAAVNGLAIGGGHVLHVICDVSIAAEHARFGQAGPRVGSFDAGYGTAFLARVVGEKRAREIWFFCRQYDARQAEQWGLVNKVVPAENLMDEARAWGREAAALSPTALRFLKTSFNADSAQAYGQGKLAFAGPSKVGAPSPRSGIPISRSSADAIGSCRSRCLAFSARSCSSRARRRFSSRRCGSAGRASPSATTSGRRASCSRASWPVWPSATGSSRATAGASSGRSSSTAFWRRRSASRA
jgi:naphthoate synthase